MVLFLAVHILSSVPMVAVQMVDAASQPLFIKETINPVAFGMPMTAKEIVAERTEFGVVFDLGTGKRAAVSNGSPLFTKDDANNWIPITQEGTVEPATFVFDRLAGGVDIRFDLTRPRYELRQGAQGYAIEFQADATGVVANETTVRYQLADGVTLRWSVEGNRVRKEILIEKTNVQLPTFTVNGIGDEGITLTENHFSMTDVQGTEVFSTVEPFLMTEDKETIHRPVTITSVGNNTYQYVYDETGLTLPYILDPSEGPNSPGTVSTSNVCGTENWSNTSNATASDNSYAVANNNNPGSLGSFSLDMTNFGFSLPAGSTVDGIEVTIERKCSDNSGTEWCEDYQLEMLKAGSGTGDDKAATGVKWATSDATISYGASNDLWGAAWEASDINASNFGISFCAFLGVNPF